MKNKNNNTKLHSCSLEPSQEEKVHFSILPIERFYRENAVSPKSFRWLTGALIEAEHFTVCCHQNLCAPGTLITPTAATSKCLTRKRSLTQEWNKKEASHRSFLSGKRTQGSSPGLRVNPHAKHIISLPFSCAQL